MRSSKTFMLLLVEDEPLVRELMIRMLTHARYQVTAVESGEEALQLVAAGGGPFALVITDVMLPGMDGPQVVEQIRSRSPEMKVLFVSGNPGEPERHDAVVAQGTQFLRKPFSRAQLLAAVAELAGPPAA